MTLVDILWLVAFVVFLAVEASCVCLLSIWFAAGALAALIVSLLGGQIWLQVTVFLIVSIVALACLRPLFRKYIKPKIVATNVDSHIGTVAVLTASVDNLKGEGAVVLGGVEWSARSTGGQPIEAGTTVRVDKIEGVRAYVSPVETPAEVTNEV